MRERLLEVTNFLGHEHEVVAFPESGLFFLSGDSGNGKSSFIVDALAFALFGSKATRAPKQEMLRHKKHQSEVMEVRALFEFDDGTRLTLVRGLTARGSAYAEAYEPDPNDPSTNILLADTANRVGRIVRQRLGGMNWQQFYAAFVTRQSEIQMLTQLRGSERKELVHRLSGMREIERGSEEARNRLRTHRAQLKGIQQQLGDRTRESTDEHLAQVRQLAADEQERIVRAEAHLTKLNTELRAAQDELGPLAQRSADHKELVRHQEALTARQETLAALQTQEQQESARAQLAAKAPALQEAAAAAEQEVARLLSQFTRSDEYLSVTQNHTQAAAELQALQQSVPAQTPTPTLAQLREERAALRASLDQNIADHRERTGERDQIAQTGECSMCLRPLGAEHDHEAVLARLDSKLADMLTQQETMRARLDELDRLLPITQQQEDAYQQGQQQLVVLRGRVEALLTQQQELQAAGPVTTELDALRDEGRRARETQTTAAQQLAAAQQAAASADSFDKARQQELLAQVQQETALVAQLQASAGDPVNQEYLTDLTAKEQELTQRVATGNGQVPELRRNAQNAADALALAEREATALADKLDGAQRAQQAILRLEDMQAYLDGFQRQLAAEIRPALEEMGSEMLNQVSGGKHVAMRLDENYEIEVQEESGFWLPAVLMSGGEAIRVNICLRLAITRLVSQRTGVPLRMLVFDEPLPSQDPGHVQRIMELLDGLRPFYPQIFVISHVGELRSSEQVDYVLDFPGSGPDSLELTYA